MEFFTLEILAYISSAYFSISTRFYWEIVNRDFMSYSYVKVLKSIVLPLAHFAPFSYTGFKLYILVNPSLFFASACILYF